MTIRRKFSSYNRNPNMSPKTSTRGEWWQPVVDLGEGRGAVGGRPPVDWLCGGGGGQQRGEEE